MRRPRVTSFRTQAMIGYAAITLLLVGGTVFAIRRLDAIASTQTAHLRTEEDEITLAERLRWTGELLVSEGRGYLISDTPGLLTKLHETEASFDQTLGALRRLSPNGVALVDAVEQAARKFRRLQAELITERQRTENPSRLVARFEAELVPLRRELAAALDRLVDYKEAALEEHYLQARRDRVRLMAWTYGLLGTLALVALGLAWYFAQLLAQAYRQEQAALERAQQALAARDELMGIVAHDLRNPLSAITLKAALLRKGAESDRTRQQAESIENVTRRMEYLIKEMLDVAIMEAGQFAVTPAVCGVEDLLREALEMFDSAAAAKQIRLERIVKDPGLAIRADRERVLQVLSNLLGNALKFTPPGGQVLIAVERERGLVRFAVSDTGPGISGEDVPHVFDRFWKHELRGMKGTGLGLFIARNIVAAHGGQIWVVSEPGHGATFYFTIPLAAVRRAPVQPTEAGGPPPPLPA